MPSFMEVWGIVAAELTPRPWVYTAPGGASVTVIPEGTARAAGEGVVVLRITQDPHTSAEVYITTGELPDARAALGCDTDAYYQEALAALLVAPTADGGVWLTVEPWDRAPARLLLPAGQRLPLLAALERAADVARGWEH